MQRSSGQNQQLGKLASSSTGGPIVVSGNAGEGHGTGGQVWGVLQPGQTGGGSNPVPAYATRAYALDTANISISTAIDAFWEWVDEITGAGVAGQDCEACGSN